MVVIILRDSRMLPNCFVHQSVHWIVKDRVVLFRF